MSIWYTRHSVLRLAYALRVSLRLPKTIFYDVYIHCTPYPEGCVFFVMHSVNTCSVFVYTVYCVGKRLNYLMQLYEIRKIY